MKIFDFFDINNMTEFILNRSIFLVGLHVIIPIIYFLMILFVPEHSKFFAPGMQGRAEGIIIMNIIIYGISLFIIIMIHGNAIQDGTQDEIPRTRDVLEKIWEI